MRTEPKWRDRELALILGAPMVLFPALSIAPVTVSFMLEPFIAHGRLLGLAIIPLLGASLTYGLSQLASCFRSDMDVITFFAGGTVVVLVVICMCSGIILASAVSAP
jgi:hypothetical protein